MLYQKIFTDEKPYHITLGHLTEFPEHRHADFELNFCVKDEFDITVEKRTYHIREGEAMFIPPMCSHSIPSQEREQSVLTLIAGMSLLKKYFKDFFSLLSEPFVCKFDTPRRYESEGSALRVGLAEVRGRALRRALALRQRL